MDALILDIAQRQSMRANDLWLEELGGHLVLSAADISPWAVLRRLGHGMLGRGEKGRLLDWRDVEFLRGHPRAALEGHDYHRRVARLQPSEIAHLLDAVPYLHAAELLTLISDALAADTLEVMGPERQVQVRWARSMGTTCSGCCWSLPSPWPWSRRCARAWAPRPAAACWSWYGSGSALAGPCSRSSWC
jgi:hypothetical protein